MKILDSVFENLCGLEVDFFVLSIFQILFLFFVDVDIGSLNFVVFLLVKILKIIEKKLEKLGFMKVQVRFLLIMILFYECYNVQSYISYKIFVNDRSFIDRFYIFQSIRINCNCN